jgi:ubiquinone/menaquinone biosynthesis C-methylase UbiE
LLNAYTNKAQLYDKYRWDYPKEAIDSIIDYSSINTNSNILDIGAGTGIMTKHFIDKVQRIYAVEPNPEMFKILKNKYNSIKSFSLIYSTSDDLSSIQTETIDLIVAAHSIHWLNYDTTITELQRISKKKTYLAIVENKDISYDDYSLELRSIINKYSNDKLKNIANTDFRDYFKDSKYEEFTFDFISILSYESLIGSLMSASFLPDQSSGNYLNFENDIKDLFKKYKNNNVISRKINTNVILGLLANT